jgi:hypothetical protein
MATYAGIPEGQLKYNLFGVLTAWVYTKNTHASGNYIVDWEMEAAKIQQQWLFVGHHMIIRTSESSECSRGYKQSYKLNAASWINLHRLQSMMNSSILSP